MSIALLAQVYDETRRLAIAGSVVAPGDFRIKKLIAPLEQAGAKAPVFAKVAEGIKAVVDANDKTSAQALLDLATLVNAILYTQGETGAAGDLVPIETTDLGLPATQTSARVIKPLLEALSTTGSGRLELIKDAHERGAFRDLRLIQPAVTAIDDVFGELAEFVTDRILPLYGKAILPALRSGFDMKGRAGHPRRLRLMHQLDPAGTRDLVKQALENGSKEVKVAAIECLGAERDDISYLLEQATAKANEVRQAAYHALASIDDDDVLAVLQKAFEGKDLPLAADSLKTSRNAKLLQFVLAGIEEAVANFRKTKDKKKISAGVARLSQMLLCLGGRDDGASEALLLRVFAERDSLAKIRGDTTSGSDLNSAVVSLMVHGTPRMRAALVDNHAALDALDLEHCFHAARTDLPVEKVFTIFSPYVTAKVDEKKKDRDPAHAKRSAILNQLRRYWHERAQNAQPPLDPRWLDLAVRLEELHLVALLIRPGHAAANAYLSKTFAERFTTAKHMYECQDAVVAMVRAVHPDATDAVIAMLEKFGDKPGCYGYYLGQLVADLPKSALPRLEALIPKLHERVADSLLGYMQQLRDKPIVTT
jgi:hypothetical protein